MEMLIMVEIAKSSFIAPNFFFIPSNALCPAHERKVGTNNIPFVTTIATSNYKDPDGNPVGFFAKGIACITRLIQFPKYMLKGVGIKIAEQARKMVDVANIGLGIHVITSIIPLIGEYESPSSFNDRAQAIAKPITKLIDGVKNGIAFLNKANQDSDTLYNALSSGNLDWKAYIVIYCICKTFVR